MSNKEAFKSALDRAVDSVGLSEKQKAAFTQAIYRGVRSPYGQLHPSPMEMYGDMIREKEEAEEALKLFRNEEWKQAMQDGIEFDFRMLKVIMIKYDNKYDILCLGETVITYMTPSGKIAEARIRRSPEGHMKIVEQFRMWKAAQPANPYVTTILTSEENAD